MSVTLEVKTVKCLCGERLIYTQERYTSCPRCNQSYNEKGKRISYKEFVKGKYKLKVV